MQSNSCSKTQILHHPPPRRHLLCRPLVDTNNHGVVSFEGLEGKLLLRLDALLAQLLDLAGEDGLRRCGRVDTVGLDGDDDTTANLKEEMGVHADDTGLIGLGNILQKVSRRGAEKLRD